MPSDIEHDVEVLKRQMRSLQREVQQLAELVDVLATPLHRKVWFWVHGYRLWRVGRWWPSKNYPDLS